MIVSVKNYIVRTISAIKTLMILVMVNFVVRFI